jgi:UDP-N-acetylglucosamine--N-acetylmuramyl-(pentapeptide) pyrophosphoryl-undecaprenol N-acetylglucosamine transferase
VLIAGGGTGGHLFPGLAIAEALQRLAPGCEIRFAGSAYGIEHRAVPARGYRLYRIPVRGLYGVSLRRRLWVLAMLPLAFAGCAAILLSWRPDLVIGVGGYASGPMLATALLLRRGCVIQEQNAWPGLTNRLLGRWVHTAFTAVPDTQGFFRRAVVTGNPVRADILALREEAPVARDPPLLFVFGGSQGARAINEAVCAALPRLAAWGRPLRILHQTGPAALETVRAAYAAAGLPAEVVPFLEDMAGAYRAARVVVSRAGASAVGEIVTARRASLLVPIPGTSGEHQLRNAQRLAGAGAALLIEQRDLDGNLLAETLLGLLENPARLDAMERATDALFPGDAADAIARACLELLG